MGRVAELVERRCGSGPDMIMADLAKHGHSNVGSMLQRFIEVERKDGQATQPQPQPMNGDSANLTNGSHVELQEQNIKSQAHFAHSMLALLNSGFIVKTRARHFKPSADLNDEIEQEVLKARQEEAGPDANLNTPKQREFTSAAVLDFKRKLQREDTYTENSQVTSRGSIKRSGSAMELKNKRVKRDHGLTNGNETTMSMKDIESKQLPAGEKTKPDNSLYPANQDFPQHDTVVHIDLTKCTIALRSQRLESFAYRFLGPDTGAVYSAILKVIDDQTKTVRDELAGSSDDDDQDHTRGSVATLYDIEDALDPELYLAGDSDDVDMTNYDDQDGQGEGSKSTTNGANGTNRKRERDGDGDPEMDGEINGKDQRRVVSKHERLEQIKHHLGILQEHPWTFCTRISSLGSGTYTINFENLTQHLISAEVDATVQARFGRIGLRIVRMLRTVGKLEEKSMSERCFVGMKTLRTHCASLISAGFIHEQEIPKDNTRQPTRTIYLYSFDEDRSREFVLQQAYKTLVRCLQRLPVEREANRVTIEKVEHAMATKQKVGKKDKENYDAWKNAEMRLNVQIGRLDETVATLRDFDGKDFILDH